MTRFAKGVLELFTGLFLDIPIADIGIAGRPSHDEEHLSLFVKSVHDNDIFLPLIVDISQRTGKQYDLVSDYKPLYAKKVVGDTYVPCIVLRRNSSATENLVLKIQDIINNANLSVYDRVEIGRDILLPLSRHLCSLQKKSSENVLYETARTLGYYKGNFLNLLRIAQQDPDLWFTGRENGWSEPMLKLNYKKKHAPTTDKLAA